jgi:hypothetical protein
LAAGTRALAPVPRKPLAPVHLVQPLRRAMPALRLARAGHPMSLLEPPPRPARFRSLRFRLRVSRLLAGAALSGAELGSIQALIRQSLRRSTEFPPCPQTCTFKSGLDYVRSRLSIAAAARTVHSSSHHDQRLGSPSQCSYSTRLFRHIESGTAMSGAPTRGEKTAEGEV